MNDDSLLLDTPIKSDDEDKLDRIKIADVIADRILSHKSKEGITIGIEGSWGSGKTSIINLVRNRINEKYKPEIWANYNSYADSSTIPSKVEPLIINFNPWIYSSKEKLLSDFFSLICHAIARRNRKSAFIFWLYTSEHIRKILETSKLGLVTSVLSAIAAFFVNISNISNTSKLELDNRKNGANKILNKFNEKIFIIIDDIDRLDVDETLLIFKLIKVVADFPNMVFILAYDKDKTIHKINKKFEGKASPEKKYYNQIVGDSFIEKIVQVAFTVPYIHPTDHRKYFNKFIIPIKQQFDSEVWEDDIWEAVYLRYLSRLLINPRDIKIYINGIRNTLNLIGAREVNPIDFLLIESLRIYVYSVYNFIWCQRDKITHSNFSARDFLDDNLKIHENTLNEILKKCPARYKNIVGKILFEIFPSDRYYKESSKLCIDNRRHFEKYFILSPNKYLISVKKISDIMKSADENLNNFTNKLQKLDVYQLFYALNYISDNLSEYEEDRCRIILPGIWNSLQLLVKEDISKNKFFISPFVKKVNRFPEYNLSEDFPSSYIHIPHILISNILNKFLCNERYTFIKEAMSKTTSIYWPLHFLTEIDYEQKRGKLKNIFCNNDLQQLLKYCVKEIEYEIKSASSLAEFGNMEIILSFCYDHGSEKIVSDYINKIINNNSEDEIIALIAGFCDPIYGNFNRYKLPNYMENNMNELDEFIREIDGHNLNSKQKEIINLYKEELSRHESSKKQ